MFVFNSTTLTIICPLSRLFNSYRYLGRKITGCTIHAPHVHRIDPTLGGLLCTTPAITLEEYLDNATYWKDAIISQLDTLLQSNPYISIISIAGWEPLSDIPFLWDICAMVRDKRPAIKIRLNTELRGVDSVNVAKELLRSKNVDEIYIHRQLYLTRSDSTHSDTELSTDEAIQGLMEYSRELGYDSNVCIAAEVEWDSYTSIAAYVERWMSKMIPVVFSSGDLEVLMSGRLVFSHLVSFKRALDVRYKSSTYLRNTQEEKSFLYRDSKGKEGDVILNAFARYSSYSNATIVTVNDLILTACGICLYDWSAVCKYTV